MILEDSLTKQCFIILAHMPAELLSPSETPRQEIIYSSTGTHCTAGSENVGALISPHKYKSYIRNDILTQYQCES